jgi:uncharacterized protein YhaN
MYRSHPVEKSKSELLSVMTEAATKHQHAKREYLAIVDASNDRDAELKARLSNLTRTADEAFQEWSQAMYSLAVIRESSTQPSTFAQPR